MLLRNLDGSRTSPPRRELDSETEGIVCLVYDPAYNSLYARKSGKLMDEPSYVHVLASAAQNAPDTHSPNQYGGYFRVFRTQHCRTETDYVGRSGDDNERKNVGWN